MSKSNCRMGNAKKKSRFICLKCLTENQIGAGIQRGNQREKGHCKNLYCLYCKMITVNLEVRHCDTWADMIDWAVEIRPNYYDNQEATQKTDIICNLSSV